MPTISPRFGLLAKDSSGAGDSKDHEVAKGTSKKNSNKNAKPKCTAKKPQKGTPYLGCFFLTAFVFPTKLPAVSTRYTWVCPRSFSAGCQGMVRQKNSLPQRADLTALVPTQLACDSIDRGSNSKARAPGRSPWRRLG